MKEEHILSELRRTAEANGGVPLGRLVFFKETGIKESDWKGKIWARWNDAVREAGFEPNQKTGAYTESFLIEKFIALIREVGRFPIVAEVRLKKLSDPTMPNSKVYERLGTKRQLAARIAAYCEAKPEYADVLAICSGVAGEWPSHDEGEAAGEQLNAFVYLMKSGRFYKIGRSNAAGRREYEIAIQLPEALRTLHTIRIHLEDRRLAPGTISVRLAAAIYVPVAVKLQPTLHSETPTVLRRLLQNLRPARFSQRPGNCLVADCFRRQLF